MKNIILCGFMGSGKTVVGRELAKMMGCRFTDTDELIEREQGIAVKAIFAAYGEAHFRALERDVCARLGTTKNSVIATGGGTLTVPENATAIKKSGGKIVFLDASFATICERIGSNASRPLFQDREQAHALYLARRETYLNTADYVIDGDMSARKTAMMIADIFK